MLDWQRVELGREGVGLDGKGVGLEELVLGLTSMAMLLLLLRRKGFGDAVEKMRKKSIASLTIFLSNQNLMMASLRLRPG